MLRRLFTTTLRTSSQYACNLTPVTKTQSLTTPIRTFASTAKMGSISLPSDYVSHAELSQIFHSCTSNTNAPLSSPNEEQGPLPATR